MNSNQVLTSSLFLFFLLIPKSSTAYNDIVHRTITDISVETSNVNELLIDLGYGLGIESKIINNQGDTKQIIEWIVEGGVHEDDSLDECKPEQTRAANHFHDPTKSWDQAFFDDDVNKTYIENYGRKPVSALLWGLDYNLVYDEDKDRDVQKSVQDFEDNIKKGGNRTEDWSWIKARDLFYSSLTSEQPSEREAQFADSLRALGQVTHLMQDMSVPAHTRNDPHVLPFTSTSRPCGEWWEKLIGKGVDIIGFLPVWPRHYETFTWDWAIDDMENFTSFVANMPTVFPTLDIIVPNQNYLNDQGGPKLLAPVSGLFDTDTINYDTSTLFANNIGLAEYTNANFFSKDTIFSDNYPHPSKEETTYKKALRTARDSQVDAVLHFYRKTHAEKEYPVAALKYWAEDVPDPELKINFLDDDVFYSYASLLIPRAVGYSATLIDYFFRGKLEVNVKGEEITIFNRSEETMEDGFFELYYDTPNGVRTLLLKDDISVYGLAPGESQVINFTLPDCMQVKLTVVYRGKLGSEQDAVIGKVVEGGADCVVIKAGDSSGTQIFTVWNPATNAVAEISDPDTGTLVSFPAEYYQIRNWLEERSATVTTPAYHWEMENNALKRIGESWLDKDNCSCSVDRDTETSCNDHKEIASFDHPGCGEFISYCDYTQTVTSQDGKDVWNTVAEGAVFVDKDFQWSILGSYAPLVNTMTGYGEAACMRSQWQQYQSARISIPDGSMVPFEEWTISQPITWITPIGEMDMPSESYEGASDYYKVYDCPYTDTWSRWHRNPLYYGEPIAKPIIYANYSDGVMVQLYFVSTVQWSGVETAERVNVNGSWECQTTSYEESYTTDNKLVASCSLYEDGAVNHDPRAQKRKSEFEDEVLSLVQHTITAQQANGEISEEDVFKGGISIYIAGKNNNGTESGLLKLINEERALLGLYPILPDNSLNSVAQRHVNDMAAEKFLSHTGSDGSTFQDRFNAAGYGNIVKPGGSSSGIEYIADGIETVSDLFTKFRISSSWDTIMYADFREMGISSSVDKDGKRYWCLTFGYNDEH